MTIKQLLALTDKTEILWISMIAFLLIFNLGLGFAYLVAGVVGS